MPKQPNAHYGLLSCVIFILGVWCALCLIGSTPESLMERHTSHNPKCSCTSHHCFRLPSSTPLGFGCLQKPALESGVRSSAGCSVRLASERVRCIRK
ncbi:hypothetical protein O6H91_01G133200 [Diphasiastrum complanatum]|uniref:Uncharacterized protein n=1 Tax=Diphasiastrum complanatum TaxID=34168 RepID=A0ACC2EWH0_DIPCM|nr:hypothetical protein O6H91_01G133200 [Diphasiastrum complanatum]